MDMGISLVVHRLGLRTFTHGTGFNYKLGNSDLARHAVLSIKKKKGYENPTYKIVVQNKANMC